MKINEKRYLKVVKAQNLEQLVELVNQLVVEENIKILNYELRTERGTETAILFFAKYE